jgi:integrase
VLGTYPTMTLKGAFDAWRAAADRVAQGIDPTLVPSPVDATCGLLSAMAALFEQKHISDKREGTASYYRRELGHVVAAFGNRQAADVRKGELKALVAQTLDQRGANAALSLHKLIKKFWNWMADEDYIETSVYGSVKPPAKYGKRKRALEDGELAEVLNAATTIGGRDGAAVWLLALTGCRRGEVLGLQWSEIGPDSITLPSHRVKNGSEHWIPLTDPMRNTLARLARTGNYVLTGTDRPCSTHKAIKQRIDALAPNLAPWTLHDLRRTFKTGLAKLGVPMEVSERAINHKSDFDQSELLQIYDQHKYRPELRSAFEKWSAYVLSLVPDVRVAA